MLMTSLFASYMADFDEIFTPIGDPPKHDMVHHTLKFCKFFLNNFSVSNVFVMKLFAESCKIRYSLGYT